MSNTLCLVYKTPVSLALCQPLTYFFPTLSHPLLQPALPVMSHKPHFPSCSLKDSGLLLPATVGEKSRL